MRVVIIYRSKSEHERMVLDFETEFEHRTGHKIEMVDVDTRDGSAMANLYDIMQYPAVLAVDQYGSIQQVWRINQSMPLINEVSYYISSDQ